MDEKNELQEFDLDDILSEFHDIPEAETEDVEPDEELEELLHLPQVDIPTLEVPQGALPAVEALREEFTPEKPAGEEAEKAEEAPIPPSGDTIRMESVTPEAHAESDADAAEAEPAVSEDATIRLEVPVPEPDDSGEELDIQIEDTVSNLQMPELDISEEAQTPAASPVIEFNPRAKLRELKRKLVAGPEKRYYELSEQGIGRLQISILLNLLIVLGCAAVTTMYSMDLIPANRLRLVIFTQVLAMLLSALLGSHQMLDGLSDLLRGRFTVNTLLSVTFAACCADAIFCLQELRIPCCAAFSLEVAMALWARYQRRTTEMAQMDTLRKAVRLHSLVKEPDYYEGKAGILRGEGRVEDFMDNYDVPSGPEKLQNAYAFLSLFACIGIAVFAGVLHGVSLGLQVFSTSLLVAVPASFFVSLTRPMAILEKRLHMVGTVLCGWQGVKGLCGKAAFPLRDEDIFPQGSTKLNGVKFYGDRDPDEVVSYTTSLICASGGGLVNVFRQLLASKDGATHPVVNFQNYGAGGIGGEVCGEPVLLGSLQFLQDMGVDIPEGTMVSQAVYAAVDGQLCAVYAITYAKMRSASAGLVSLGGCRKLTPILIGGDFMLTDSLLKSKFGVNTRRVSFPAREVRTELSARQPDPQAPGLALATRDELVSYAYAVTGSRALRTSTRLGVAIHLIGGIVGMLIMLTLSYLGSTELLTPTHILLYQLVWMVPGLLVTEWTRTV